ncbi:MAG: diguanylate cyclase [Methylophilaceae bacterium]|nr:diguanylate cyclase [Methylophilaceae bacterium]
MNLADFITENMESILQEWEEFANSLAGSKELNKEELRDHAKVMLSTISKDLMSPQSESQQQNKSVGKSDNPGAESTKMNEKASSHGEDRFNSGFSIQEVVSEFRALRASVLKQWEKNPQLAQSTDITEINRFNESIDQVLAESVDVFANHNNQQMKLFETALQISPDHNYILNKDGCVIFANKAMADQLGLDTKNIVGKRMTEFEVIEGSAWQLAFKKVIQEKNEIRGEIQYGINDGKTSFYEYILTPVLNASDEVEAIAANERDITMRKTYEETLWHQANFDHLTDLPNRNLFLDRLNQQIKNTERSHSFSALFYLDLDNFKWTNDNYGHEIGDCLLQEASKRISLCVRQNDTVCRLGGDEFTVILTEFEHIDDVKKIADKIITELAKPFLLKEITINISGSIGIALIPQDARNSEELIAYADQAMYEAKRRGSNQYRFFSTSAVKKLKLNNQLNLLHHLK